MEEAICESCGCLNTSITRDDAIVCIACGTVATSSVAVVRDVAPSTTQVTRRLCSFPRLQPNSSSPQVEKGKTESSKSTSIPHKPVSWITSRRLSMGVDAILESVVRQIWMQTLSISRCLEPGLMHRMRLRFSPLTSYGRSNGEVETRRRALDSKEQIWNHWVSYTAVSYRLLRVETIVWVMYAASVWMQEAIGPCTIAEWIENGRVKK